MTSERKLRTLKRGIYGYSEADIRFPILSILSCGRHALPASKPIEDMTNPPAVVALESAVIGHGLPRPVNVETALRVQAGVREEGSLAVTVGILKGRILCGLTEDEIRHLGTSDHVRKVSRRDIPVAVARGYDGATTVSATAWIAHRAGIRVMATGGIGGVHRQTLHQERIVTDVSADLDELARTPIAVVCSGPKAILDAVATREYLETRGVTIVGYQTDEMPEFYIRSSGLAVDVRCDSPEEVAAIVRARFDLGLDGAVLVCVPVPEEEEIPRAEIEATIAYATEQASRLGISGRELTPYLLETLRIETGGRTVQSNVALLLNNARVASAVARELAVIRAAPLPPSNLAGS